MQGKKKTNSEDTDHNLGMQVLVAAESSDPQDSLGGEFRHLVGYSQWDGFAQAPLQITPLCGFPLERTLLKSRGGWGKAGGWKK